MADSHQTHTLRLSGSICAYTGRWHEAVRDRDARACCRGWERQDEGLRTDSMKHREAREGPLCLDAAWGL